MGENDDAAARRVTGVRRPTWVARVRASFGTWLARALDMHDDRRWRA